MSPLGMEWHIRPLGASNRMQRNVNRFVRCGVCETSTAAITLNHPEFNTPLGFCEPAGWLASN
jgi:hypothetical protein